MSHGKSRPRFLTPELGALIDGRANKNLFIFPKRFKAFWGHACWFSARLGSDPWLQQDIEDYLAWVKPSVNIHHLTQSPSDILPKNFWQAANLAQQDNVDVFWEVLRHPQLFCL